MKLQRTTLGLVLLAALLGGFVYFYEIQGASQRRQTQTEAKKLFPFKESQIAGFTVKTGQQTLVFQRTQGHQNPKGDKQGQSSAWTLQVQTANAKQLSPQPASEASVAYLLNLLATGQRQPLSETIDQKQLTAPASRAQEFGLDQPLATVEVKLDNQARHRLILGKPNFNNSALYAQVDPPTQSTAELQIALVSMDFRNAVTRPLSEWKAQPPKPQKTPSPSPS
jgi:hypothetical protein